MGFLSKFFAPRPNWPDEHILRGYRHIAAVRRSAPGPDMSDDEILEVYRTVEGAFQKVACERGKRLSDETVFNIGLFFIQKYQMIGRGHPTFFAEHIAYEVDKYRREGLRKEYDQEISMIRAWGLEEAEWFKQLPEHLQFRDLILRDRLEILRDQIGLSHEMFMMALTTSRSMTRRSVHSDYQKVKRAMPGYHDKEYLAITIMDRLVRK